MKNTKFFFVYKTTLGKDTPRP